MLKTSLQLFRLKITIKLELIKKTKARKESVDKIKH